MTKTLKINIYKKSNKQINLISNKILIVEL